MGITQIATKTALRIARKLKKTMEITKRAQKLLCKLSVNNKRLSESLKKQKKMYCKLLGNSTWKHANTNKNWFAKCRKEKKPWGSRK